MKPIIKPLLLAKKSKATSSSSTNVSGNESQVKSLKNVPKNSSKAKTSTPIKLSLRASVQLPVAAQDNSNPIERSPFRASLRAIPNDTEGPRTMTRDSIKPQFFSPNGNMLHHDVLIHRNKVTLDLQPKRKMVIKKGFGSSSNRLIGPAFLHNGTVIGETTYRDKRTPRKPQIAKRRGIKRIDIGIKTSKRMLARMSLGRKARFSIKMANRRK